MTSILSKSHLLAAAAALLVTLATPAAAIDFDHDFRLVDEIRLGAAAHDPGTREDGSIDIIGEVLSGPIVSARSGYAFVDGLLSPRLLIGVSLNTAGRTDLVHAGFAWRWNLTDRLFVDGSLGGAWNDSPEHSRPNHLAMGCAVTFREGADLGMRLTDHVNLLVGIAHASHAGLCGDTNPGLTQVGAKLGYHF